MGKSGPAYDDKSDRGGADRYNSSCGLMVVGNMWGVKDNGVVVVVVIKLPSA